MKRTATKHKKRSLRRALAFAAASVLAMGTGIYLPKQDNMQTMKAADSLIEDFTLSMYAKIKLSH